MVDLGDQVPVGGLAGVGEEVDRLLGRGDGIARGMENKWYVDELYETIIVRPLEKLSQFLWRGVDMVIDGTLSLGAYLTALFGEIHRLFQTGNVRNYALMFFVGVIVFVWVFA